MLNEELGSTLFPSNLAHSIQGIWVFTFFPRIIHAHQELSFILFFAKYA